VSASRSLPAPPAKVGGVDDEAFAFKKVAQPNRTEVDVEEALVNLFKSDLVASEQGGDEDAVSVPTDPAIARNQTGLEVPRIRDGLEFLWEGAR